MVQKGKLSYNKKISQTKKNHNDKLLPIEKAAIGVGGVIMLFYIFIFLSFIAFFIYLIYSFFKPTDKHDF